MKTAMTELIEFLENLNSERPNLDRKLLQTWCESKLLEKEKNQIINAHENWQKYFKDDVVSGEDYYERTFIRYVKNEKN